MQVRNRFSHIQEGTFVILVCVAENELGKCRHCTSGIKAALTNGSLWRVHLNKADLNGHTSEIKSCMVASGACQRISCPQGKSAKALMNFYQR